MCLDGEDKKHRGLTPAALTAEESGRGEGSAKAGWEWLVRSEKKQSSTWKENTSSLSATVSRSKKRSSMSKPAEQVRQRIEFKKRNLGGKMRDKSLTGKSQSQEWNRVYWKYTLKKFYCKE